MIETVKNAELKERKEELLKNMKMLRHCVADVLGSKSFFRDIEPGGQNGVINVRRTVPCIHLICNNRC